MMSRSFSRLRLPSFQPLRTPLRTPVASVFTHLSSYERPGREMTFINKSSNPSDSFSQQTDNQIRSAVRDFHNFHQDASEQFLASRQQRVRGFEASRRERNIEAQANEQLGEEREAIQALQRALPKPPTAAERTKDWIVKHHGLSVAIAAVVVLPPVAVGWAFLGLWLVGFGSGGVDAGSLAATMQSRIGNVDTGSLFAMLQSASAEGYRTPLVGGVVFATTLVAILAVVIPKLIRARG